MNSSVHPYIVRLGKTITVQAICRGAAVTAGIVSTSLLTRTLGPEGYGTFTGVMAAVSVLGLIADGGLNIYSAGEAGKDAKSFFARFGSVLAVKAGLVGTFAFLAIGTLAALGWGTPKFPLGLLAVTGFAIGYGVSLGIAILTGLFRVIEATLTDTMGRLISLAIVVAVLPLMPSPAVPFLAFAISNIIILTWLVFRIRRVHPEWGKPNTAEIKRIALAIAPLALGMVWTTAYMKIDTVILSALRSPAEVGVYGLGYTVLEQLLTLWGLYMMTAYPHMAKAYRDGAGPRILARERVVALATSVLGIVGVLLIGGVAISLVAGSKFTASMPLLSILVLSLPFFAQNNLSYHRLIILGRQWLIPWIYAAAFVLNVVLNLILIPRYGAIAAAWMTVATEAFVFAGYAVTSRYRASNTL